MKQNVIKWLVVIFTIFTIWNFADFFMTGSLITLGFGCLMLWINWDFLVREYHLMKNKYRWW